jgi:hypothetical protein
MRADKVELSWDSAKNKWLVRIQVGEEVIRRHCNLKKDADEQTLLAAATQTARDEGYEVDRPQITVHTA